MDKNHSSKYFLADCLLLGGLSRDNVGINGQYVAMFCLQNIYDTLLFQHNECKMVNRYYLKSVYIQTFFGILPKLAIVQLAIGTTS